MRANVYGAIIPNDYKWYYDFFKEDSTCPRDIAAAIQQAAGGRLDVYVNSPGGVISSGSEIYTMLREYGNVKIHITGEACSAASIIAMAGECEMSPTALMMVHCVSANPGRGDRSQMEHVAEILKAADEALCTAYAAKSGMSREEALEMMEAETWLTAEGAKERGLIDSIMFEGEAGLALTAAAFRLPDEGKLNRVREMLDTQRRTKTMEAQKKLNLLKLEAKA